MSHSSWLRGDLEDAEEKIRQLEMENRELRKLVDDLRYRLSTAENALNVRRGIDWD